MKLRKEKLWSKLFGVKVGDLIRLPYGKVDWEVSKISYKERLITLKRFQRSIINGHFFTMPWYTVLTVSLEQELRIVGHV